jgi:hypothetical protein
MGAAAGKQPLVGLWGGPVWGSTSVFSAISCTACSHPPQYYFRVPVPAAPPSAVPSQIGLCGPSTAKP